MADSTVFLPLLRAEEERLLVRLRAIQELLRVYDGVDHPGVQQQHRTGTMSARIAEFAAAYLKQVQRRASPRELAQAARERGVEVRGKEPATIIGTILSRNSAFDHVPRVGYGLVEWHLEKDLPCLTPTSCSSSQPV